MTTLNDRATTVDHPLEPLTADEMIAATDIIQGSDRWNDQTRFVYLELEDPPKAEVVDWSPGDPWNRLAAALLRDRRNRATY